MTTPDPTPEQGAHAQGLAQTLLKAVEADLLTMTRLLASKPDPQVLGQTESQARDLVHQVGAQTIEAALDARPTKVTKDRV
jgi:hypothetical protein